MFKSKITAAVLLGAASLAGVKAHATTSSFTFTQGGWTSANATLTGTFTGNVESNGVIQLGDLTSFQADFHDTVNNQPNTFVFNLPNTTDFSFDTNSGSLSFASGSLASNIILCSGATTGPVCFGLSPQSGAATNQSGFFEDLPNFGPLTTAGGINVSPVSTATPEPQSIGLIAAAGSLLLGCGIWRRRYADLTPAKSYTTDRI